MSAYVKCAGCSEIVEIPDELSGRSAEQIESGNITDPSNPYYCDACERKATSNMERAIDMTGGSADTLAEALDQWEREREALVELFDENEAFTISFRIYDLTMTLAEKIINTVEIDAAMFMTQKSRDKIAQFREQHQKAENAIVQSKLLIDHALERRALDTITEEQ